MTSRDRDPGKIAGAFPSRAQGIMEALKKFDSAVRTFADNNPESEAAMRVEANGGKTSRRSPSRVSGAQRAQLTGVRENLDQQGWMEAPTALPHLCFPPDTYPQACGPGSEWRCRCAAVWVSKGIMWADYPQTPTRTEAALGPERWHYVGGGQLDPEDYQAQEALYDWRPLGPYYVKLFRAMIDNQLVSQDVSGVDFSDWRDLG